jgi:hypothetical protein
VIVRSPSVIGAAVLALALIGACDWPSPLEGEENAPVATSAGRWERVPGPPGQAGGLQAVVPVVVGDRVVVIAGVAYDQSSVKGVVFDLGSGRWSRAAPSGLWWRVGHSAVAVGDRVIIWGGCCGHVGRGSRAPGATYDVSADTWSPLGPGPLGHRYFHTAVWTGTEMIVWGGLAGTLAGDSRPEDLRADGAAYNPRTGTWRRIAPAPLSPRQFHVAVWSGREMIVWGGSRILRPLSKEQERLLYDGAAYDPKTDSWRPLRATKALARPSPILGAGEEPDLNTAWTGEAMIIWSRSGGALYEPGREEWTRIPVAPPGLRHVYASGQTAVWSGEELIVWGVEDNRRDLIAEGAAYDPEAKRWTALPEAPVRGPSGYAAIWTGEGMLVWGGRRRIGGEQRTDGAIYVPG